MLQYLKLPFCVIGIFGCFSYFAVLQEDLYKKTYADQKFKSIFFMMVAERALNAIVALFAMMVSIISLLCVNARAYILFGISDRWHRWIENPNRRDLSEWWNANVCNGTLQ